MKRSITPVVASLSLAWLSTVPAISAEIITRRVGKLTVIVDQDLAYPGGLLVVHLRPSLATTYAILLGRRVPFFGAARGPRALVPVPVGTPAGPTTLGIELMTRSGGRQRIAIDVAISPRTYPPRTFTIPETKRSLLARKEAVTDGRRLLSAIWTSTPVAQWNGPLLPPLATPPTASFGSPETFHGGSAVDSLSDAMFGEYHRGYDYDVPSGTTVLAPAGGTVVLAAHLTLSGQTLAIDHGQGVVSVFFHLGRIDAREGDHVEARNVVGQVGDSGIAATPHLHWGTYVHSVAVDPGALLKLTD